MKKKKTKKKEKCQHYTWDYVIGEKHVVKHCRACAQVRQAKLSRWLTMFTGIEIKKMGD